ncbi:hypothetical protein C4D60_Mb07t21790 [Musa balbisiana]|uniref:HD-ZIP protein N-terminal domain-containing protein n=1 Tax=Musa balbisiana TaxID=52838 RepID=A0A4S8JHR7_MUSBA|nr:hypothetical protein C4D60_Mb07t21790 [Musa balbisiana]
MMGKDDLGLSLSLSSSSHHHRHLPLQLNLMPSSSASGPPPSPPFPCHQTTQWAGLLADSDKRPVLEVCGGAVGARSLPLLRGIDVNRAPSSGAGERDSEEDAGASSPNSTLSSVSGKRAERDTHLGDEHDPDRACSRGISDEEDGDASRKKLRLSKDQSAILEESFKEHNTLNPQSLLTWVGFSCVMTEAKAGVGQTTQPEAKTSGSVVSEPKSKDEVEANRGGLRVPAKVLRDPHRREQETTEGSARAESSEAVASVLHAHDSSHHAYHVPFLRARLQLHRVHDDHHHHNLNLVTVCQRTGAADAGTPSVPPPPHDPGPMGADRAPAIPRCPSAALVTELSSTISPTPPSP